MKALILICGFLGCSWASAGGHSAAAVPTKIEIVQNQGFMVSGAFGNSAGCTSANSLFVKLEHAQYKLLYATALAALMSGKKISTYVHICEAIGWYSGPETTYNIVNQNSPLAIGD